VIPNGRKLEFSGNGPQARFTVDLANVASRESATVGRPVFDAASDQRKMGHQTPPLGVLSTRGRF